MKDKIEGILRDLLSKIPVIGERFAPKDSEDDEELEDGTTEVDIGEHLDDDDAGDEVEEDEDEDEEVDADEAALKEKQRKRTLIIRGVAILLLVYLAADYYFSESTEQSEPTVDVAQQAPQNDKIAEAARKRKEARLKAEEAKKAAQTASQEAPAVEQVPVEAPKEEQVQITEPEAPSMDTAKSEDKTESITSVTQDESPAEEISLGKDESTPEATDSTLSTTDASDDNKRDELIEDAMNQVDGSEESVTETPTTGEEVKMSTNKVTKDQVDAPVELDTSSVVEKAEKYTSPPDYEERGRGLVYNCTGKHWACVDRKAYFQCRKNERWQKQNGKPLECHLDKTYASNEDCETVQKYKVNTNAATDFCSN